MDEATKHDWSMAATEALLDHLRPQMGADGKQVPLTPLALQMEIYSVLRGSLEVLLRLQRQRRANLLAPNAN